MKALCLETYLLSKAPEGAPPPDVNIGLLIKFLIFP
jgi:hypothetical protein